MQLIYLYIDNYKNIKKQGFNFSSEFNCDFKDVTLKMEENSNINIFPNNINITAIVGKNGSGKSSIIKVILMLIFYNKYKDLDKEYDESLESEQNIAKERLKITNLDDFQGFLIIKKDEVFYKLAIMLDQIDNNKTHIVIESLNIKLAEEVIQTKEITEEEIDFFTIYYNYTLSTLKDGIGDDFIDISYHRTDGYQTPILLEPFKYKNTIHLDNLEYLSSQKFANIFRLGIKNKFIEEFFNPNFVNIKINTDKITNKIEALSKNIIGNPYIKIDNKCPIKLNDEYIFRHIPVKGKDGLFHHIINIPNENKNIQRYEIFNKLYIAFKLLEKRYENIIDYDKLSESLFCSPNIEDTISNTISLIDIDDLEKRLKLKITKFEIPKFEIQKLLNAISFHKNILIKKNNLKLFKLFLDKKVTISEIKDIIIYLPPWIDIEYFEKDKSYKSLSSGEKMIYSFMINLMYQLNNIKDKKEYKSINLFLDEIELSLHPDWQKKYLSYILKTLQEFDIKINIILATHSPFILSDIPKENIIFLDDGKNVSDEVEINTFGANIHTLLSHGFFMEDGLMGEFARNEIEKVIKFLNGEKKTEVTKNKAWNIIQKIGEPFLKMKLEEMYSSKFKKDKLVLDKIEELKSNIKRLEND